MVSAKARSSDDHDPQCDARHRGLGIFSITAHWNDLFWPLIVVQTGDIATPALGTLLFRDQEAGTAYGPLMAGAIVIALRS